jgi:cytochrome c
MGTGKFLGGVALLLAALPYTAHAQSAGDSTVGKRLFAQCRSCHTTDADGPKMVGPNLHGVFGRKAGSLPGFEYSDAMKKTGIVWDDAKLNDYIKQPSAFIPGNKMAFMGVVKDQARLDIIAYLKEVAK